MRVLGNEGPEAAGSRGIVMYESEIREKFHTGKCVKLFNFNE